MRPALLFVSPTMPAPAGNGLAMRAGLFLDALAATHRVFLVVVPVASADTAPAVTPFVARRTARTLVLSLEGMLDPFFALLARARDPQERARALHAYPRPAMCRFATPGAVAEAAHSVADVRLDAVHIMRAYLAPFADPYIAARRAGAGPRLVLDLDESDSRTLERLSALRRARGDAPGAAREASEAAKHARLEASYVPRFDRVLVASEQERARAAARHPGAAVDVVPNAVRVPARPRRSPPARALAVLFVGSLGYLPNEDGALFLCQEVLPVVRRRAGRPVLVRLVGSRPGPAVRGLTAIPGVGVEGSVRSVAPFYAAAHVAVVPVRAGGGTRIKVLEAFAHRVPVVSTTTGAEGLAVEDGTHLLLADDPEAFAEACVRVAEDAALARRLTRHAAALVEARHAHAGVARLIRRLHGAEPAGLHPEASAGGGRRDVPSPARPPSSP